MLVDTSQKTKKSTHKKRQKFKHLDLSKKNRLLLFEREREKERRPKKEET